MISADQVMRLFTGLGDSQNALVVSKTGLVSASTTNSAPPPQDTTTPLDKASVPLPPTPAGNTTRTQSPSPVPLDNSLPASGNNPLDAVTLRDTAQALINANRGVPENNRVLSLVNLSTPNQQLNSGILTSSLSATLTALLETQTSSAQSVTSQNGLPLSNKNSNALAINQAPAQTSSRINQDATKALITSDTIAPSHQSHEPNQNHNQGPTNNLKIDHHNKIDILHAGKMDPAIDFSEFLQNTLQGEAAKGNGLLSMVVLNAAMIPGWPAPPPFTPLPPKKAEAIHNAIIQGKIKDDSEIMEYLAGIGVNKGLLQKVAILFKGVEEKAKLVLWLSTFMAVVGTILRSLSKELTEELSLLEEDEFENTIDGNRKPRKRLHLTMN